MRTKKINNVTNCPKIDIYLNGVYWCSTDQSKTIKRAIQRIKDKYVTNSSDKVTAYFDYE